MKKKEITKDPIRDKILNFINNVGQNKQTYMNLSLAFAGVLLFIIIYSNKVDSKMSSYNLDSSISQNKYIDGIEEIAIDDFNEMIENYSKSESYNQAFIYLLSNALEINDHQKIEELLNNNSFSTSDKTLQSMVYNLYGNYYLSLNDVDNAGMYYRKAIDNTSVPEHLYKFKLNLLLVYLESNKTDLAEKLISSINIDEVVPYKLKNKYEQIISMID